MRAGHLVKLVSGSMEPLYCTRYGHYFGLSGRSSTNLVLQTSTGLLCYISSFSAMLRPF